MGKWSKSLGSDIFIIRYLIHHHLRSSQMTKRRVKPNRLPSSDEEQSRQSISPELRSPAVVQRLYRLYGRNARRDGRVEVAQFSGAQLNRVHGIYTAHNDIPTIEESALRSGPLPGRIESILPPEMASGTSSTVSTPTTVIVQSLPAPQYSPGTIQSTIQSILEGLGSWIPRRNRENETESGAIAAREPAAQSYAHLSQSPSPPIYSPITPQHTTPERTTSQVDESPGLSFRGDPDSPLYGCRRPKSSHHPSSSQAQHVETQQESSPRGRPPKVPDWVRPTWAPQAGYQEPPPIDMAAPGFDYSSLPLFTHTDANKRPTRPWKVNRRRYACPICGCAIAKKENMEHHIRTHLQSNPWLCRFCPSRFKRDYDAYPHIERTHKDKAGAANLNTLANKKRLRDEEEDEDDTRNPSKKTKKSAKFRSIPNCKQSAKYSISESLRLENVLTFSTDL